MRLHPVRLRYKGMRESITLLANFGPDSVYIGLQGIGDPIL
jgi:hypothetical protein